MKYCGIFSKRGYNFPSHISQNKIQINSIDLGKLQHHGLILDLKDSGSMYEKVDRSLMIKFLDVSTGYK